MGQPRPLFCLVYFFSKTSFTEITVVVSGIQTRIVGVEGEHADHHHGSLFKTLISFFHLMTFFENDRPLLELRQYILQQTFFEQNRFEQIAGACGESLSTSLSLIKSVPGVARSIR